MPRSYLAQRWRPVGSKQDTVWLLEPVPLPEQRKGPGFLCLVSGARPARPAGLPFEFIDLATEPPDVAACYGLFRKYLLDYRSALTVSV